MKKLTQAEEQIMQALWTLDQGGYIKDILEALDAPKPHHNTVATLLKISGLFFDDLDKRFLTEIKSKINKITKTNKKISFLLNKRFQVEKKIKI